MPFRYKRLPEMPRLSHRVFLFVQRLFFFVQAGLQQLRERVQGVQGQQHELFYL